MEFWNIILLSPKYSNVVYFQALICKFDSLQIKVKKKGVEKTNYFVKFYEWNEKKMMVFILFFANKNNRREKNFIILKITTDSD